MSERLWFLKKCDLLQRLPDDQLRMIEDRSRACRFARRSPIYLPADQADAVLILASGRAKICHLTPDGKQSILALIDPGDMFGELALLDDEGVREEYAEAIEASTVVMVPKAILREMMRYNPDLSMGVTKMIGLRRRRIETRLKNVLFLSNRERLTHLLLELADRYGQPEQEGIRLGIGLSHQDLANVIGSTRETVTVVLGEMQAEGLLRIGRRRIQLLRIGAMREIIQPPIAAATTPQAAPVAAAGRQPVP